MGIRFRIEEIPPAARTRNLERVFKHLGMCVQCIETADVTGKSTKEFEVQIRACLAQNLSSFAWRFRRHLCVCSCRSASIRRSKLANHRLGKRPAPPALPSLSTDLNHCVKLSEGSRFG